MTTTHQQIAAEAEVFVDLVLADDDLMRAEFDALIAAGWESPCEPPSDRLCVPAGGWAARPLSRWSSRHRTRLGRAPRQRPHSRERGPPRPATD
ncbi:hypothetical protein GCM10009804_11400 [Kribbella hippodromi]|uniref:Uncharacterized protein n=1 Tax=Kribbella hippodromi TaxID=434347 RepID=A0ABN2CEI9_9ACTN